MRNFLLIEIILSYKIYLYLCLSFCSLSRNICKEKNILFLSRLCKKRKKKLKEDISKKKLSKETFF